ncbi:GTP cyclohydrolase I, partial [Myxococcota bacterium]|nr:GTP cyclohydrolase I [Myxococcota bacterium]
MSQPEKKKIDQQALQEAFTLMLKALGVEKDEQTADSPRLAAALWSEHLLKGYEQTPEEALGKGIPTSSKSAVLSTRLALHMICPHHLTTSLGYAHVAYVPNERIVGFGRLSRLVQAATARLVLQEESTQII